MRIQTSVEATGSVTLSVAGTFNSAGVADFERALLQAQRLQQPVFLDLTRVRLIDRPALKYLIDLLNRDIRLVICPAFVEQWIAREIENGE
jgi:anti-anti-sigma regulatory factor